MEPPRNPLEMSPECMRETGYRVIDLLVERIASLGEGPVWRGASPSELGARLDPAPPMATIAEAPQEDAATVDAERVGELIDTLRRDVLDHAARIDHPRFMAFVPSCPTWPSILGDVLAAGHNVFQGTWLASAGPSHLELLVLDWFRDWLGLPAGTAGILTSGGSVANLEALVCAREARLGGTWAGGALYLTAEAHSSVTRAARVLGVAPEQLRTVPHDAGRRMVPEALAELVAEDRARGVVPVAVVASAGATGTGAIDPLDAIADVAAEHGVWLHVDAAYGGFAVLTERGRFQLRGISRADSVTLDPHKWLFQTFEAGCLLVREGERLERAFRASADYLQDTGVAGGEVNFGERGLQLTRSARALKIWLSLQAFGVEAFGEAIDRALDLARIAADRIEASAGLELLSPPSLGVVCFRRRPPGEERGEEQASEREDGATARDGRVERINAGLVRALRESGAGMISSTRVDGVYALRLCILNHRTTERDVHAVLDWLESAPLEGGG